MNIKKYLERIVMRILVALIVCMASASGFAADQHPLANVSLVTVGKYEGVISDAASRECVDISHEMRIKFTVLKTLLGSFSSNEIEMLKCYHYGDNPFKQDKSEKQEPANWLLLLKADNGQYREIYSAEILDTSKRGGAICPVSGERMFELYGLPLQFVDYVNPKSVNLHSASKYEKWYYAENKCYAIKGDIATLTKGIYVNDIVSKLSSKR